MKHLLHPSWVKRLACILLTLGIVVSLSLGFPEAADETRHGAFQNLKVGALEAGSWNGIVFIADDGTAFQVRVGAASEFGDFLDGDGRSTHRLKVHPLKGKNRS